MPPPGPALVGGWVNRCILGEGSFRMNKWREDTLVGGCFERKDSGEWIDKCSDECLSGR